MDGHNFTFAVRILANYDIITVAVLRITIVDSCNHLILQLVILMPCNPNMTIFNQQVYLVISL